MDGGPPQGAGCGVFDTSPLRAPQEKEENHTDQQLTTDKNRTNKDKATTQ